MSNRYTVHVKLMQHCKSPILKFKRTEKYKIRNDSLKPQVYEHLHSSSES